MTFEKKIVSRRQALTGAAAISAAGVAACSQSSPQQATPAAKKPLVLDYENPKWNRDAYARIQGTLDFTKEKIGWFKGKAIGVVPGKKNIEICGFEAFQSRVFYRLKTVATAKCCVKLGFILT